MASFENANHTWSNISSIGENGTNWVNPNLPEYDLGILEIPLAIVYGLVLYLCLCLHTFTPEKFVQPLLLYVICLFMIGLSSTVKSLKSRFFCIGVSVAAAVEIIRQLEAHSFLYSAKDSVIKIIAIQQMGSVVMILWEGFSCLKANSKLLPKTDPPITAPLGVHRGPINRANFAARNTASCYWDNLTPRRQWWFKTLATVLLIWAVDNTKQHLWRTRSKVVWDDMKVNQTVYFRRLLRNQVTLRETAIRAYFAFETVWGAYSWYTRLHYSCALFFVGLGIDEPEEWPPSFGDIRQAWNIRRFWSKYYDRLVYRTITGYSEMTMVCIGMGQRPYSDRKRWLLNGFIFLYSALY
ncbi:hypothetical protein CCHL11_04375 [Colletotrichum chlorophyti]|uniref:Wax synthase domain-containing protein n=1 Tax=Colletotrichum chlorophyti TaxID=708187 RepID=A0A1Q8RLS8_9PEZI|nr:hypothetical protein CCHL11_04375 [Colletotrichum chlorophyti]